VAGFALRGRIRDGITDTDTMRSGALRRTASRAAHSTARDDCSEPSAPTTIGMLAMTVLLDWVALTGSELATDEGGQERAPDPAEAIDSYSGSHLNTP